MTGVALHKTGITVLATMPTSHIRINTIIKTRNGCLAQNCFREDLSHFHKNIITEE
jgi:hypothetical protein